MSPELFKKELTMALLGANDSIDIMCSCESGWTFPVPLADVTALCDQRLTLRYLVRGSLLGQESSIHPNLRTVVGPSWQIRCSFPDKPTGNCIIVDRDCAFLMSVNTSRMNIHHVLLPERLDQLATKYQFLWATAASSDRQHFAYEAGLDYLSDEKVSSVEIFSSSVWEAIIHHLAQQPQDIYSLTSRQFEELIAELLQREGYTTELTGISRDGGRDVLATLETPIGKQLFLVECKRFAINRPVGVSIVRGLFGVIMAERATGGLIATTSTFSRDARMFQASLKYQIGLRDFTDLQTWLRRTVAL